MTKDERYLSSLRAKIKRTMKRRKLSERGMAELAKVDHTVLHRTLKGANPTYTNAMRMLALDDNN